MSFQRYRPASHFIAPHSWSNDPCGAVYVPETQEYLLCYQWNPGTVEGGNCAWGMAKSKDLVTWEDRMPAIWNGPSYDSHGVFSGSIVSRVVEGKRVLYLFYTSVSALPIHWSKPYIRGCETQSVAISTDFGSTWLRHQNNPLMQSPPKAAATTGWRDPFISPWLSLSKLLGLNQKTDYMMIASGERNHGPQLHLYKSDDLVSWDYVSALVDVKLLSNISSRSKAQWGINFECASFFTLNRTDYILVGVEEPEDSVRHNGHCLLWISGKLTLTEDGSPTFEIQGHGMLDHGVLYAAHLFRDEKNRLIQLGWADETAKKEVVQGQGWAGCLGHPRELVEISAPLNPCAEDWAEWNTDRTGGTMTTLGVRPAPQVESLREGPPSAFKDIQSTNFEIQASFSGLAGAERFVFNVLQSPDSTEVTQIVIDIKRQEIVVDRSRSSTKQLGTNTPDRGDFKLLPGEDLDLRIFVDVSIVEVFANERFALTSRVYPSSNTSNSASYNLGGFDEARATIRIWDGLRSAWPGRSAGPGILPELHPLRTIEKPEVTITVEGIPTEVAAAS